MQVERAYEFNALLEWDFLPILARADDLVAEGVPVEWLRGGDSLRKGRERADFKRHESPLPY